MSKKFEGKTIKSAELKHVHDEETDVAGEIMCFTFTDGSHIDLMCEPAGCDERVRALFVEVNTEEPVECWGYESAIESKIKDGPFI